MEIDPKVAFYIGLVTALALAMSNGAVWTDAIPASVIPMVKAWNGIVGLVGTTVLTVLHGMSGDKPGPLVK